MVTNTFNSIQKYLAVTFCSCILVACGGGGGSTNVGAALVGAGASGGGGSSGSNNTPAPQITSFTVTPSSAKVDEYVTLTWATSDATSCTAGVDWQGSKGTSGTEEFKITQAKQYQFRLTCDGNGQAVSSVYVDVDDPYTEGSCTTPHSEAFPERFMGDFEIPLPQYTLPDSHVRDVGLKDFGLEWVFDNYSRNDSNWASNCTKEEYVKLHYRLTIMKLQEIGANSLTLYNFVYWEDANADLWVGKDNWWHISKETIEWIVKTAHEHGLKVNYTWQFMPLDKNQKWLFKFNGHVKVDMDLLNRIWDAHENLMAETAEWAQQIQLDGLSVDWNAMWICFCGLDGEITEHNSVVELHDQYMKRASDTIDTIRSLYSGEIWVGALWNDYRVLRKVDYIQLSFSNFIEQSEEDNWSVELVRERALEYLERKYNNFYGYDNQLPLGSFYSTEDYPVTIQLFAQSTEFYGWKGWQEDGFCTSGTVNDVYYAECMQLYIPIDFSVQAIWYEGVLQAIYSQQNWTIDGVQPSCSYWLTPTLVHDRAEKDIPSVRQGFPEISQSIRGKPAENILKYWWTGEYEQYNPIFSD